MTTWRSLLDCVGADVTLERIRPLIAVTGTESLTVEFKEGGSTPAVAECAAAMANAHGGLILVGVTDKDREIVGMPREAMAHVADVLATHWSPPTGCLRSSRCLSATKVRTGVSTGTVKAWHDAGLVSGHRYNDHGQMLYRPGPNPPPPVSTTGRTCPQRPPGVQ